MLDMASNRTGTGKVGVRVGALSPFTVQIPSWLLVVVGLALVSSFVHVCALSRASYSLRTLIGLAGLSLFLASTTATQLASEDDSGVQQLLWCLCTSILTDNYDPNADAHAWKRVLWMLSTWLQLGLMFHRTSVASTSVQHLMFRIVVVLKGLKLHFLHGWHRSSWDETKDDSKTQCEHLAAAATWREVDWSHWLEPVQVQATSVESTGTSVSEDNAFFWRSLLEGKPRRATSFGRDCCDIAVKFKSTPGPVVPALAFSIKRQFKAKLGSMATLSAQYSYFAITEMFVAFSIIVSMLWEYSRREEKRNLPATLCMFVWCLELVYHFCTCRRAFLLSNEVHEQSSEKCRKRKDDRGLLDTLSFENCLVISDLILGSIVEAVVTWLASFGRGSRVWKWLATYNALNQLVLGIRNLIAICILPMALLVSAWKQMGGYLEKYPLWKWVCSRWLYNSERRSHDWRSLDVHECIIKLQELQKLLSRYREEMSRVERVMYPSISTSTLEAPFNPTSESDPTTSYSLTALEAVFFAQLLGQAAAFIISSASETEADLRSLFHVWTWTSKAFKGGMVDSSWLPPNISRAMWHGSIFEGTKVWQTALLNIRLVFDGEYCPAPNGYTDSLEEVSKASDEGVASLEAARRAVMHLMHILDVEHLERSRKVKLAMRAALFAVVAFCRHWGGPETVAVPGPLEHESLMACIIAPAFKNEE